MFRIARDTMPAFPIVEYRAARCAGRSVRSGVDGVIAACALRHGLTVAHHGRDFDALTEISARRTRAIRVPG